MGYVGPEVTVKRQVAELDSEVLEPFLIPADMFLFFFKGVNNALPEVRWSFGEGKQGIGHDFNS
jgi:hypothetical protein